MLRFIRRNKRWEGVSGLSGKGSKHGSTKTGSVERGMRYLPANFCAYHSLFLSSTWSAFQLYTELRGGDDLH